MTALVVVIAPVAAACDRPPAPTLAQILDPAGDDRDWPPPDTEILGVYEQEHIAGTPWIGLRDTRTVSVVTRYWGVPPDLGRVMHGDATIFGASSCGNESGSVGDVGLDWVTTPGQDRGLPGIRTEAGMLGLPTAGEEAALTARFGPPTVLEVDLTARFAVHAQLWWLPYLLLALIGAAVTGIVISIRRRHTPAG